ncbi:selenocysteine-specific translation elongation factor [Maridesulfovibrio salexigens]|uniref:Selenocysteine-specific elongation factor n=1 Tax=Maridesulfovibrio salexigens (strain ATCC 14822 / DSM 2638 / NCIMB 8403 / VKM B-1763) TaxID=526222 RepID=C6BW40_MARSD|nr:selenocysteine-specific translation elongation factor [Maridesulfovibrio salexigens]ACS80243.1 selenocysteine-specific translation elongation factor [Maridesulfovibrio salexigens DSM 2638]
MPVVMGTAGHIDHGKTSLIKALTGTDCDRLAEEKKRGITIELGFASLDLGGDEHLSIIDVPGHEKFVKNMVAGAAGIDFVLLVIAADEGVMPQTREHLEICTLLGIEKGFVVLTKADMVDEDWMEMVQEDVREFLAPSFLAEAPIHAVSSHTGQGLDELRGEIAKFMKGFSPKRRTDLARLPVDRVFTMKGHGTVVTGTLISGQLSVGDDVVLYPKMTETKVRSLQSHGASVETAPAGRRTAINLHGLEVEEIERGEVLGRPGTLFPSKVWDVELTCLPSSPKSLKHRKEIHFHHGSKEVMAKVYFLDREKLEKGERAVCQIRFDKLMTGVYGDRVVLRSFSPLRTIAGGSIINPLGRKVKRFSDDVKRLESLIAAEPEDLVLTQLDLAGRAGLTFQELSILSNVASKPLEKMLQTMGGQQKVFLYDKETRSYVSGTHYENLVQGLLAHLAEFHKKEPMKPGVSRGEIGSTYGKGLPDKLFHSIVERLLKKNEIVAVQEILHLPGHKVSLASDQQKLRDTLMDNYEKGGLTPPNLKDVLDPLDLVFKEAAPVYKLLQDEGLLVRIKDDMYFAKSAVDGLQETLEGYFAENEELGPQDFKALVGLSRKFSIPLLEYMDKEKVTIRVGDKRRLRKQS